MLLDTSSSGMGYYKIFDFLGIGPKLKVLKIESAISQNLQLLMHQLRVHQPTIEKVFSIFYNSTEDTRRITRRKCTIRSKENWDLPSLKL